jgi:hypothetical protein
MCTATVLFFWSCCQGSLLWTRAVRLDSTTWWSGRRPYITNRRRIKHVLDQRLGSYSLTETRKIAALALRCLSGDARCRPDMGDVVTVLEGLQETKGKILKAIPEEENI